MNLPSALGYRKTWLLAFALASSLSSLALAQEAPAAAGTACFPACRDGYLCSPSGQCVSACNPPCDSSEQCVEAQCVAKHQTTASSSGSPLAVLAGPVFQIAFDGRLDATAPGISVQLDVRLGLLEFFIRPRLVLVFFPDLVTPEFQLDLGYSFFLRTAQGKWGANLAVSPGVWVAEVAAGEPIGFYYGARLAPFFQHRSLIFSLPFEYGVQTSDEPDLKVITFGFNVGYAF